LLDLAGSIAGGRADWIGLAATTFVAALLYTVSGFGFAVLAAPLYLLFVDPPQAIQLVIIISTALSLTVGSRLRRAIAWGLLARLAIGVLVGLPVGLVAFRYADPLLVRLGVGVTIFSFALLMAVRWWQRGQSSSLLALSPGRDFAAGVASGIATALVGMAGPPALIYLLLAGAGARTVRATLLAFFALAYGATLISHAATIGIPGPTWVTASTLIPFALLGGFAGRPIGDRLGTEGFTLLVIALLAATGLYTIIAASICLASRQQ
jgi:uncharacterized membrane protein YfcA